MIMLMEMFRILQEKTNIQMVKDTPETNEVVLKTVKT